jgi:ATP-dependent RNA helicase DDX51/DBP6
LDAAFAVQSVVVPLLLDERGGDVCISAATGSGKTLAYVLPIVQALGGRVVTRLRAVVVVPTRELVAQVSAVAGSVGAGSGIKVGTAVGSRALAAEQGLLVDGRDGSSKVDVLVTTPGRLVEHVQNTKGFTLQHVRWLVIDEADRLLAQSFQEWVGTVVGEFEKGGNEQDEVKRILDDLGVRVKRGSDRVRKVVLSATMTRDAGKLAGLKLRRPQMVVVEAPAGPDLDDTPRSDDDKPEEIFSVPAELKEIAVPVLNTEYKPLYLMYILRDRGPGNGTLVFVKSNEAAARLSSLVETFISKSPPSQPCKSWTVGLVTGEMERKRREKVLRSFRKGETHMYRLPHNLSFHLFFFSKKIVNTKFNLFRPHIP